MGVYGETRILNVNISWICAKGEQAIEQVVRAYLQWSRAYTMETRNDFPNDIEITLVP